MRRNRNKFKFILIWILIFEILLINGAKPFIIDGFANSNNTVMVYEVGDSVHSVDISFDGKYIVVGSNDEYVYFFNNTSNTPLWNYNTGDEEVRVSMSSNGEYITTGSRNGRVYLFKKNSSIPLWYYCCGFYHVISDDGQYIFVGGNLNHQFYYLNNSSNNPLWNYTGENDLFSGTLSSDGKYIAALDYEKVLLFEKTNSTPIWSYEMGDFPFENGRTIAISSDGQYIVSISQDISNFSRGDIIHFFNRTNPNPLWTYSIEGNSRWVCISSDGRYIVAANSHNLYLFNSSNPNLLWSHSFGGYVRDVSISSDGQYIAVGDNEGKVYLFNNTNNIPLWSFSVGDYVRALEISSNGQYIAAASANKVYLIHRSYKPPPDYSWVWIIIISSTSIGVLAVVIYLLFHFVYKRGVNA